MRITMDGAGRVVIPKSVRDAAGITAGAQLEIACRDGRIEIEIPEGEMRLSRVNGLPVISRSSDRSLMSATVASATLQTVRLDRHWATTCGASRS